MKLLCGSSSSTISSTMLASSLIFASQPLAAFAGSLHGIGIPAAATADDALNDERFLLPGTTLHRPPVTATKNKKAPSEDDRRRSLQSTPSCLAAGLASTFSGACTAQAIKDAVTSAMAQPENSAACAGSTFATELFILLRNDDNFTTDVRTPEAVDAVLSSVCDVGFAASSLKFGKITGRGDQFDREFMNGGSDWNDEYQVGFNDVVYHKLADDAARIQTVHDTFASNGPIEFPEHLTNFQDCDAAAAMCCYVSDRQANDEEGGCNGTDCSDSDPASNTNVCHVDMSNAPVSSRVLDGFAVYHLNADSEVAEGQVKCHGFAWNAEDDEAAASRYKGNVLFDVAFKKNFLDRGYVRNVPGAPMCGCIEQMPIVEQAECTKIEKVIESWSVHTDTDGHLVARITDADVSYGPCDEGESLADSYKTINAASDPDGSAIEEHLVGEGKCLESTAMAMTRFGYKRSVLDIASIVGSPLRTSLSITFTAEVADSAADITSYKIYNIADDYDRLTIVFASLDSQTKSTITLVTSEQTEGAQYKVEIVGNVEKRIAPMVKLDIGSAGGSPLRDGNDNTLKFDVAAYGYEINVPESEDYVLVYDLDIPTKPNYGGSRTPIYTHGDKLVEKFSKVAYWLELESVEYGHQWVWVSMDAFTTDIGMIGVPTFTSQAVFNQNLGSVNIVSNQANIGSHTGVDANIEFWPFNYQPLTSSASPEGASNSLYDFGDSPRTDGDYGSMQIHSGGQTLFAFNKWNRGDVANLGIGDQPDVGQDQWNPDWTFAENADKYTLKNMKILVVATDFITEEDRVPVGTAATIDDSEGYLMAYELDIPTNPRFENGAAYKKEFIDNRIITRVAYFMELESESYGPQWVWVSMDAFTTDASKTGVPCLGCGMGVNQKPLTNVNIVSNLPDFNGTALDGNIEFWPFDFSPGNAKNIPQASSSIFDTGDKVSSGGSYGSMQIHADNPSGVRSTVFAFNNFNRGQTADIGIGNRSSGNPDWVFAANSKGYTMRKLSVYVK